MCFSAEVSFGLSMGLLPAGIYCIKNAYVKSQSLFPVAVIPLIFGFQQICEGYVWTGLRSGDLELARIAALVFLFFAVSFWPFWIPFCSFLNRKRGKIKVLFGLVAALGLIIGLVAYIPLLINSDAPHVSMSRHSLDYALTKSPAFELIPPWLWSVLYIGVVTSSLLLSEDRPFVLIGVALVVSVSIIYIMFRFDVTSLWCFFSAIFSLYLCVFFRNLVPVQTRTSP